MERSILKNYFCGKERKNARDISIQTEARMQKFGATMIFLPPPLPSCSTPSPRECVNNRTPLTVAHGKKEKRKFKNRSIADALGRTFKYTCERWGSPREFSSFIKSAEPFTNNRRLFAERHFIKRSSLFLQKRIEFIQIRRDAVVLLAASPGN